MSFFKFLFMYTLKGLHYISYELLNLFPCSHIPCVFVSLFPCPLLSCPCSLFLSVCSPNLSALLVSWMFLFFLGLSQLAWSQFQLLNILLHKLLAGALSLLKLNWFRTWKVVSQKKKGEDVSILAAKARRGKKKKTSEEMSKERKNKDFAVFWHF